MQSLHPNIVFVLFESFQVKAFYFKLLDPGKKDSYVFQELYKTSIPFLWKKDNLEREVIVTDLLTELVRFFELHMQDVFFSIVSDDADFYEIPYRYETKISVISKKDLTLIPYFTSSYVGTGYTMYTHAKYYTMDAVDNQGNEEYSEWENWNAIATKILGEEGEEKTTDIWLNNLIRPVITSESFFISSIAGLLLHEGKFSLASSGPEIPTVIAGGEVFSWLKNPRDVIFPFLVGLENPPSLMSIYHDMENILALGKVLKELSLGVLERSTARFVVHVGEIITLKAKKQTKQMSMIGKISIHDDDGYKSIYPILDDIMVFPVKGLGRVTLDLHYPFYVDDNRKECKVRDLLVIDARINQRDNIMNYKGWYDRIKTV